MSQLYGEVIKKRLLSNSIYYLAIKCCVKYNIKEMSSEEKINIIKILAVRACSHAFLMNRGSDKIIMDLFILYLPDIFKK